MLTLVAPALAVDPLIHVVQKGETLYGIARQYGLAVDVLIAANKIGDVSRVPSGARLLIPGQQPTKPEANPAVSYTVQKGDTLFGISRKFGTSAESIQRANSLRGTTIRPGQILTIPGAPGIAASGSTSTSGGAGAGAGATGTTAADTASVPASDSARPAVAASGQTPAASTADVPATAVTVKSPAWPVSGTVSYLQGKLKGATINAQPGASLMAVRAGTVISAGPFRGFGKVAFIQASDGLVYVYGGAASLNVLVGDSVRRGTTVGTLARGEDSIAYFFVFKGQDAIDPASAPRD